MPSQTVDFDEKEDTMIEFFKTANRIKNKGEAIRQMIKIAYKHEKENINKKMKILS